MEKNKPYLAKSCIKRHICAGLFTNYFHRHQKEYEDEIARDYNGFDDDMIDEGKSEHYYWSNILFC